MRTRTLIAVFVTISLLLFGCAALADSWIAPYTKTYSSPGTGATVTVTPQKDKNGRYLGYANAVVTRPNLSRTQTRTFKLLNNPHHARLFPAKVDLFLVTFDTWGRLGYKHTLVIYDGTGKLIRDLKLEDLLSKQEIFKHVRQTTSSRWWRKGTKTTLDSSTAIITLRFSWGKVVRIDLRNGKIVK